MPHVLSGAARLKGRGAGGRWGLGFIGFKTYMARRVHGPIKDVIGLNGFDFLQHSYMPLSPKAETACSNECVMALDQP